MQKLKVRTLIAIFGVFLISSAKADLPAKSIVYYYGEPQMTNLSTGEITSQKVLFQRITDPASGFILEDAYSVTVKSACTHSPAYIVLGKDGAVNLTDVIDGSSKPTFHGIGTVAGNPWLWNHLKFSIAFSNGMRIEDDNFILPDQTLTARKQFFHERATSPFMLYDGSYFVIDKEQYTKLFQQMDCVVAP